MLQLRCVRILCQRDCVDDYSVCTSTILLCMYQHNITQYVPVQYYSVCTSTILLSMYQHNITQYVPAQYYSVCTSTILLSMYQHNITLYVPAQYYSVCASTILLCMYQLNITLYVPAQYYSVCTSTILLCMYQHNITLYVPAQYYSVCTSTIFVFHYWVTGVTNTVSFLQTLYDVKYTILFVMNYYVILGLQMIEPEVFGLLECYTSHLLIICEGSSTTSPEDSSASICLVERLM
jgi:hypothetical protein